MNCRWEVGGGRCKGNCARAHALYRSAFFAAVLTLTPPSLLAQQTRAERSGYTETSTYADVVGFLDALEKVAAGKFSRGVIGTTVQGRALPYVVASRPLVRTPEEARATGRPIVYVQGNIHGGEVEGKESLQALLRDLLLEARPNALDSIVLIAVPIYNADGNEVWGPQERQRGSQNGPAQVGQRPNADSYDLNRDYIKNEAPETLASLAMFRAWDPDMFVDLHTTNGSYHGYALTYSPSLHPAAMLGELTPAGPWTRDTLLPEVRRRMREKRGVETFEYGNFSGPGNGRDDPTTLEKGGWRTYEHKPRFGTNYYGLRGRVSVLSEAYSHDPFETRVKATTAFVGELLSYAGEQGPALVARTRGADALRGDARARRTPVPIRAEMTKSPFNAPVLVEALEATGDTVRHEPGLRPGFRRTHRFTAVTMPVYDRFDATRTQTLPEAWVLGALQTEVVARLRDHGITVIALHEATSVVGEAFRVDSVVKNPREFQGHREVRLEGRWERGTLALPAGTWVVRADQPLALLAAIMLEPESDDGLTTWNVLDEQLGVGRTHPVRRALAPPSPPAR